MKRKKEEKKGEIFFKAYISYWREMLVFLVFCPHWSFLPWLLWEQLQEFAVALLDVVSLPGWFFQ
jgi:hypothetical protein